VYIHYTPEIILENSEGKKLLVEAVYLMGVMLMLLDFKIQGSIRERMLVSYYRYKGHSIIQNIDEVCSLCRNTGFIPGKNVMPEKRPPNYPEDFFNRCTLPMDVIELCIGHLKDDDFYNQVAVYPSPEHRPTALSHQAAILIITLYFNPTYLENEQNKMREIIDKFFPDNWVVAYYLGFTVDLAEQWAPYKAAKSALLQYTLNDESVLSTKNKHIQNLKILNKQVNHYLKEGVLTEEYILSHSSKLMHCMRDCNVTLKWLLLSRLSAVKRVIEVVTADLSMEALLELLMNVAQFERNLKGKLEVMLEKKDATWQEDKMQAAVRMNELAEYFSGTKPLSRGVQKNEGYMQWFQQMEQQINSLNLGDEKGSSRKIQQLTQALEDVEQYHQIEGNLQIKVFLNETRQYLRHMSYTVNLQQDILQRIARITDFSYAWLCMDDFLDLMQAKIRREPVSVRLLESTILKLSSIMDIPLLRIIESDSPDLESVSEYYSKELVKYVRRVLQVIPHAVFMLLDEVAELQSSSFKEIPEKLKRDSIKDYACLEERHRLAALTHEISVFTKGVLIMEKTFVGLIEVDPKKLLEDGIRKELVNKISNILHKYLNFKDGTLEDFIRRIDELGAKLTSFKQAFEYIQDFIGLYGLKIWQEEMTRVIGFNIDLEASTFLPMQQALDTYQSANVPIPKLVCESPNSLTFMGVLLIELLKLCDIKKNVYIEWMHGWYDFQGKEVIGLDIMSRLHRSLGIHGLSGIDKLLCCTIVQNLKLFVKKCKSSIDAGNINNLWRELQPMSCVPERGKQLYQSVFLHMKNMSNELNMIILRIGQMNLLRRLIAYEINFRGRIDSPLLWSALMTVNQSVVNDVKSIPEFPAKDDKLIGQLEPFLNQMGFLSAFEKIFLKPGIIIEKFPLIMALYTIYQMSTVHYEKKIGGLIRNKQEIIDGVPFTAGILTIFKQFHRDHFSCYLGYIGQFVSTGVALARDKKTQETPAELTNILVFIEELRKLAGLPRQYAENFLPSYILDRLLT